jgi:hypothetical protein
MVSLVGVAENGRFFVPGGLTKQLTCIPNPLASLSRVLIETVLYFECSIS